MIVIKPHRSCIIDTVCVCSHAAEFTELLKGPHNDSNLARIRVTLATKGLWSAFAERARIEKQQADEEVSTSEAELVNARDAGRPHNEIARIEQHLAAAQQRQRAALVAISHTANLNILISEAAGEGSDSSLNMDADIGGGRCRSSSGCGGIDHSVR